MFNNGYYPDITFTCDQTDFYFSDPGDRGLSPDRGVSLSP